MNLYDLLHDLTRIPEPFAVGGTHELWCDPHVQRQMLACHLDPDIAAASREHAFIDRSITWLIATLDWGGATVRTGEPDATGRRPCSDR